MSAMVIAKPYAKAAFEIALECQALSSWRNFLAELATFIEDKQVKRLLANPSFEQNQLVQLILEQAKELHTEQQNFLKLIAEQKRLSILPTISIEFNQLSIEYEKAIHVEIVSASLLTEPQKQLLIQALQKRFKREIKLKNSIKPELLAGAIIYADHLVIDGSVFGQLQRLNESLF